MTTIDHPLAAGGSIVDSLPTTDDEVWRYSRIDELDPALLVVASAPTGGVPAGVRDVLAELGAPAIVAVVVDGHLLAVEGEVPAGLTLGARSAVAGADTVVGAGLGAPHDAFARWNDDAAPDPLVVSVAPGVVIDEPIVVIDWVEAAGVSALSRLSIALGANTQARVLWWQGGGSATEASLAVPLGEAHLAQAARLGWCTVQDRAQAVWQIASHVVRVERDATVTAAQAALGGDYARSRFDCHLAGRGATGNLSAVYFGERSQMLDLRTFQEHAAPDTTSTLLFKGAVSDTSRAVYSGLIRVGRDARGTNAFQTNRNLKLSDGAWAESVPNLEIENNDVRCSHASTVGPIDPDQAFYLESRGVPPQVAERLVVAGFFEEVVADLPVPAAVQPVRDRLDACLSRVEVVVGAGEDS
jgi:Fe-S cluster assembly protein SufD